MASRGHGYGTGIRDVYLGTDRLTEGVLGIRRTAPKVSAHMLAKGTLGIRSVAPEFCTCGATRNHVTECAEQVVSS